MAIKSRAEQRWAFVQRPIVLSGFGLIEDNFCAFFFWRNICNVQSLSNGPKKRSELAKLTMAIPLDRVQVRAGQPQQAAPDCACCCRWLLIMVFICMCVCVCFFFFCIIMCRILFYLAARSCISTVLPITSMKVFDCAISSQQQQQKTRKFVTFLS